MKVLMENWRKVLKENSSGVVKTRQEWKSIFEKIRQQVAIDSNNTTIVDNWWDYKDLMSIDTPQDKRAEMARKGSAFNAFSLMYIEKFRADIIKDNNQNSILAFYAAPTGNEQKGPSNTPVDPNRPIIELGARAGGGVILRDAILKQPGMEALINQVPNLKTNKQGTPPPPPGKTPPPPPGKTPPPPPGKTNDSRTAELEKQLATFEKYSHIPAYKKRADDIKAQIDQLKGARP